MANRERFIKDVVHGEIVIDHEWAYEILRSKEFTRLNRIKQLGLTLRLFPNATHTRFTHSLGSYYLANQIIKQLDCFTKAEAQELAAAALLHDVGHGPHSHSFEDYTSISHEHFSKAIILDKKSEIHKILVRHRINPTKIVAILNHNHRNNLLNDLISSQIDVDRMDYLARDSQFTGACYGKIDSSMMIKWITLKNNRICFYPKAISSIENFLLARYHMYQQVYEQPKIIAVSHLIRKMLARFKVLFNKKKKKVVDKYNLSSCFLPWLKNKTFSIDEYINLDDCKFEMFIDQMKFEKDQYIKEAYDLYSSFANSDYKVVPYSKSNYDKYRSILLSKTKYPILYMHKCKMNQKAIYKKDDQPILVYDETTNSTVSLDQKSLVIKKLIRATRPRDVLVIYNNI